MKLREITQQSLPTVAELIDRAGIVREQKAAIEAEYNELRKQIELHMQQRCVENPDVLTGKEFLLEEGLRFNATYKRGTKRTVKVKNFFKRRPDLFWTLCKVGTGDLEKVIGKVEASEFILTDYAETPELNIVPRKDQKEKEGTQPKLRSVA